MVKEPERTCIVCRKKGTKNEFVKVVKNKLGEFAIEKDKRLDGRGAYICKSPECRQKCLKSKTLNRVFKTDVPMTIYEELVNG